MKTFKAENFTATQWETAQDKAKFCTHFARFIVSEYDQKLFSPWFYRRLSSCFSHIAHYNRENFYDVWFSSHEGQRNFLLHCANNGGYGDPTYTYSDAEKVLKVWITENKLADIYS